MIKTKRYTRILCCIVATCLCLVCAFPINVQAQTLNSESEETEHEYVTGKVMINTSRALGDPNADVYGDGVRLRSGPSTSYSILELMYNGEYVSIDFTTSYRQSNGTWYYVKRIKTGTWGWAKADYIFYWD